MQQCFNYYTYELVRRRAAFPLLQRYCINRYELWLLVQLAGYLQHLNKSIISKGQLFDTITGNKREQAKMNGYYTGLVNKRFVGTFEYISRPGTESVGISDLGASVLAEYERYSAELMHKFEVSELRHSKVVTFTQEPPKGTYFAKTA
jgi:hypothetical protein